MTISNTLLPEFDQEMANTRKTLERVPDGKADWKPHAKSMPLGVLSSHIANIPFWLVMTMNQDALDIAPPGQPPFVTPQASSTKELLEFFDKNMSEGRAGLVKASDEHWMQPWSLLAGGQTLMTMPRIACYRTFVMNHSIHHRAQLGVYLRLNDIAVPGMYGPSADEK
jgi:uncharacterized damage-inducible protein DinB